MRIIFNESEEHEALVPITKSPIELKLSRQGPLNESCMPLTVYNVQFF